VALSPDGTRAFVALTLDDALAVVDLTTDAAPRLIPLAPKRALDAVARGERLFFDARLSHDGWMSCHSCHTEGHTSGQLADTLGDRSYGAPKLTPSLLGVGTSGPWNWTGSVDRLEDQVRASVETTMRGAKPSDAQVADLTAYLRSLEPPKPLRLPEGELVAAGLEVFRREGCVQCHAAPGFTKEGTFDVGLVDELGTRKFNPPSLRGVGRRDALLHDGRARSLEELFGVVKHPAGRDLVPEDRDALVEYLGRL
jgi:cytochrome c peroxidase